MPRFAIVALMLAPGALAAAGLLQLADESGPAAFFQPAVVLSNSERGRLDRGDALVKVVRTRGPEVVVFAAVQTTADGERLASWIARVDRLKQSEHVPAIARFSEPPELSDLSALTLDESDLDALRDCRPQNCDIKLSANEIKQLGQALAGAGRDWKSTAQEAFRRMLLARVGAYLSSGLSGIPPYVDGDQPVAPASELRALMAASPFLDRVPPLVSRLDNAFGPQHPGPESFLYWSKERLGGKAVVAVTHVNIARPSRPGVPTVVVTAHQIYASHYITGSLAVTTIAGDGERRFLMYLNRSRVDVLDGLFGGLVRRIMERRLRAEAGDVVQGLQRRLESGPPPN